MKQSRTPVAVLALAAALAATLAGCGSGQEAIDVSPAITRPTTASSSTTPAPTPVTASTREVEATPKVLDAAQLAAALQVGKPHVWTAETDPNKLLGRPGGYTSAATVVDKRVDCDDPKEPGASCGATVEVFASPADAKARSEYIQGILKGGGILGTEYHTLAGAALLRVTGELTPKQAAVYEARFRTAARS